MPLYRYNAPSTTVWLGVTFLNAFAESGITGRRSRGLGFRGVVVWGECPDAARGGVPLFSAWGRFEDSPRFACQYSSRSPMPSGRVREGVGLGFLFWVSLPQSGVYEAGLGAEFRAQLA